jgi:hypothetical protein
VAEKVEVTKEDILAVLDAQGQTVLSKTDIFVACARRVDNDQNWNVPQITWARRVIDVPAAERLLEKMLKDVQVHVNNGPGWYRTGLPSAGLTSNGAYYASPTSYAAIKARGDVKRDKERFDKATEMAMAALVAAHQEEYSEMLAKTLESLRVEA